MQTQRAVGRIVVIAVVVIVIVIIAVAGFLALSSSNSISSSTINQTQTTIQSTSSTSLTGSQSTSSPSTLSTSNKSSSTANSSIPSQLIIDEASNPGTMEPTGTIDNNAAEIVTDTLLTLIFCLNSCSSSTYIPVLATNWTESPNGMTYTFNLRNGVYFSNGDPFNAYVVWFNIYREMIMNQADAFVPGLYLNSSGVTAGDLNSLNNPTNIPGSNQTLLKIMQNMSNSVTVMNASTVQFHLTNPSAAFLNTMPCSCVGSFSDPFTVEQHGGVVANQPNVWMASNATTVGDGPYIMQTWVQNQYLILVKNPHYWAQNYTSNLILKPASIPKIVINYKTDELTRSLDLGSGKTQASIITFNDIKSVLSGSKSLYIPNVGLSGAPEFIGIDAQKAPTDNILVRRAVVEAVNVSQIEQTVYNNYSVPLVGPTPKPYFGYNSSISPTLYNVTDAKALLARAGYPNGNGLPPLNLVYQTSAYLSLVGQIVKQDLSQIGITVTLEQVSSSAYLNLQIIPGTNSSAPFMFAAAWTGWADFSGYEFLISSQYGVYNFLNNQTINNLITESNGQVNATVRAREISQITLDVQQQAAFIWLGQDVDQYPTGDGFGPIVWSNCVVGQWSSVNSPGVEFNALTYKCNPS
ncbi:MAG: ABC transporter substrate-binding protein [Thaumarchaeota archaeon]|nr:ABC transporter substrate-binding protein [Nitrososphaerota archaeon]